MLGRLAGHEAYIEPLNAGKEKGGDKSFLHNIMSEDGSNSVMGKVTLATISCHCHLQTEDEIRDNAALAYIVEFILQVYLGAYHSKKQSVHPRPLAKWSTFEWEGANDRSSICDGIARLGRPWGLRMRRRHPLTAFRWRNRTLLQEESGRNEAVAPKKKETSLYTPRNTRPSAQNG